MANALALGLPSRNSRLEHGYRVPRQAFDLALPVLASAAPDVEAPVVLRDVDHDPVWTVVPGGQLATAVARAVIDRSKGYFVGVVAHPDLWNDLRESFNLHGLKWAESTSGELSGSINLVTPEDAKGLEFDAVIIVDPQRIIDMPHGLRLLYIALTRTTTMLDLVMPLDRIPQVFEGLIPAQLAAAPVAANAPQPAEFNPRGEAQVSSPGLAVDSLAKLMTIEIGGVGARAPRDGMAVERNPAFDSLAPNLKAIVEVWVEHYRAELEVSVGAKLIPALIERLHHELVLGRDDGDDTR